MHGLEFLPLHCEIDKSGKSPCKSHPLSSCDSSTSIQFLSSPIASPFHCLHRECTMAKSEVDAMKAVVSEYEDAMKRMISELQQLRATKANDDISNMNKKLVKELSLLEQSYSDLRSRFEDIKVINEGLRKVFHDGFIIPFGIDGGIATKHHFSPGGRYFQK